MVGKRSTSHVPQTFKCSDYDTEKSKTSVERKLSEDISSVLRVQDANQRMVGQ
jgi:hypothetical protein